MSLNDKNPHNRIALLFVAALLLLTACSEQSTTSADTLIINGDIRTMDEQRASAEAVAIRDGRIMWLGTTQEAQNWKGEKTRIIDAQGRTVLPGFIDTHIHPVIGAIQLDDCSLGDEAQSVADMAEKVRSCLQAHNNPQQIFSVINLNPANFHADKNDLDAIDKKPFALFGTDGHTAWANSAALALAGINGARPDLKNGRVSVDEHGGVTGHLVDDAVGLLTPFLIKDDLATQVRQLEAEIPKLHAVGLTSMMEASANVNELQVYQALAQHNKLTVHTTVALYSEADDSEQNLQRLNTLRTQFGGNEQFAVNTVKIFMDGVLEYPTQSAALIDDYLNKHGHVAGNGPLYVEPTVFNAFIAKLAKNGFNVHLHAIGDRAVRSGLDGFELARKQALHTSRFSISHLQLIAASDIPRFKALDVSASFQLFWAQPENYSVEAVQPFIGVERSAHMYPAASVRWAGGRVTGGSDWNVSTYNPFEAIAAALCRCNPDEPERLPLAQSEALDLDSMLRAYTINAAYALGREQETGSITLGKWADVIILQTKIDDKNVNAIRQMKVLQTYARGQLVYAQNSNTEK